MMEVFDLKRFRQDKKITQTELKTILDCQQSFISSIENGKRSLPKSMISILQSKFGDISDYITIQESPISSPETILKDTTPEEFMFAGADAFTRQMAKMMNDKLIAPYGLVEEKDKEIAQLYRRIGRLEAENERLKAEVESLKRGNAQEGGNAICADAV